MYFFTSHVACNYDKSFKRNLYRTDLPLTYVCSGRSFEFFIHCVIKKELYLNNKRAPLLPQEAAKNKKLKNVNKIVSTLLIHFSTAKKFHWS
jgi:hypothetical protein